MALEKERKYLIDESKLWESLKDIPFRLNGKKLIQMYLVDRHDHSLRIRIINDLDAQICYKYYLTPSVKDEIEFPFDLEGAREIYESGEYLNVLEKTRYYLDGWDIDIYPFGLAVAEYEYNNKENRPIPNPLPDWVIQDVTGVEKYSNPYIAKHWEKLNKTK